MFAKSVEIPSQDQALPGRDEKIQIDPRHAVHGRSMVEPFPPNMHRLILGLGCFWGAERKFWNIEGVYTTAVGYSAGHTSNPSYAEVCTGMTGHNEVVLVVYDPEIVSLDLLLKVFWESHDPTQGMRQGNDRGTQYRSGIYYTEAMQGEQAALSLQEYQQNLSASGFNRITTEILPAGEFYYAEDYHQQYLEKNPAGYCSLGSTGVLCS
ncbi:MAG: peptide-methionine (S)-S-oxide reductase MsrA [Gammaproteobacteria bacterium]|jgi:peptide-methionine (S)-S-oxide reductase|nr:peptide-methionine (S)-S-oxide reductase MsrA [Gammaproteobacteria bacterium]MCZ6667484.1 peptide-methionine (S)-S-oxide reductase MsrA [Gammaproteobacteria bacterium]MCZ6798665.1 peptide-methionine (S)-S-oxide reductase MsrA [Gammaproteobacteria bacterium]MCZ6881793.1 peptide-methionine (S)-S-oxide reductase MsrA [Gammaproteobacteria bacterium]